MIKIIILSIILIAISCNMLKDKGTSYWESKKNNFKHRNLNEFISDSILRTELKSYYKMRHKSIDSLFASQKIYLYSWQNRDSTKDEFTVVEDNGELGLSIYYLIFEKNGKLVSVLNLAGAGDEGGYIFERKSKFISKDTILHISAITQWLRPDGKLKKTIGDSTFSYLIIDDKSKVTTQVLKKVKELNYSSN